MSKKALINVDLQNDFFPDGALGVLKGDEIIEPTNKINAFAKKENWLRIKTRDWHLEHTKHFKNWPKHCIQDTKGAEFREGLDLERADIISKGMGTEDDGYSGFEGVTETYPIVSLKANLEWNDVNEIYILGLTTDYCVKATALDAVKLGFKTYVLIDACRAVNINPDDEEKVIVEMKVAGVTITTTEEVMNEIR